MEKIGIKGRIRADIGEVFELDGRLLRTEKRSVTGLGSCENCSLVENGCMKVLCESCETDGRGPMKFVEVQEPKTNICPTCEGAGCPECGHTGQIFE